ncbi:hypothetical protein LA080_008848 [Diaporthe eres]|nr:hypothetical protein LA080_008848 [Diaporthe eres]
MSECILPDFREIDIELLRTGNLADGTVKCNGRTWKVHRLLLASRLKFFKAAFFGSFKAPSPKKYDQIFRDDDANTAGQEATSGEVEFPEADPDAVDIMLRHLYSEGLTVQDLNTPILCVRCWKLADYVQLDTLKYVAGSSLGDHFNAMALLCTSGVLKEGQPDCLRPFFDAFQEVCADTPPLRIIFVSFLWVTRFETGLMPRTLDILKENPTVNKALLHLLIYSKFKHKPGWIPDIVNIERHIRNRIEVAFWDEVTCSECRLRVNTPGELRSLAGN